MGKPYNLHTGQMDGCYENMTNNTLIPAEMDGRCERYYCTYMTCALSLWLKQAKTTNTQAESAKKNSPVKFTEANSN